MRCFSSGAGEAGAPADALPEGDEAPHAAHAQPRAQAARRPRRRRQQQQRRRKASGQLPGNAAEPHVSLQATPLRLCR